MDTTPIETHVSDPSETEMSAVPLEATALPESSNAAETASGAERQGQGQAESQPFRARLPEALRDHACLENVETLEDLAQMAVDRFESGKNLERVLGKKLGRLDRDDVLAILGRPESPDAYDFPGVDLPDGMAWDQALETRFRNWAYDAGLTAEQARELGTQFAAYVVTTATARSDHLAATRQDALRDAHSALRRDWGEMTAARIAQTRAALTRFGGEGLVARLTASGLDHDPGLLRFVDRAVGNAAGALGEDGGSHTGATGGAPGNAEARRGIDARYRDQEFMRAYTGPDHPRHAAAVAEMQSLFEASRS